jgi:hypothetical protein
VSFNAQRKRTGARTLICSIASPAGASSRSTKKTCGKSANGASAQLESQHSKQKCSNGVAICGNTQIKNQSALVCAPHLTLQYLCLRIHGADDAHLRQPQA